MHHFSRETEYRVYFDGDVHLDIAKQTFLLPFLSLARKSVSQLRIKPSEFTLTLKSPYELPTPKKKKKSHVSMLPEECFPRLLTFRKSQEPKHPK